MTERLLTIKQLSELLQVKFSTIYKWTHCRQIPCLKLGRLLRFREADILEWLKDKERNPEEIDVRI